MMTKVIAYTRPDGGVSICIPAPNARREGESEAEFIARIQAKDVPKDATNIRVCTRVEIPYRGRLRNAWRQNGVNPPVVDMIEARILKTNLVRIDRDKLLIAEDVAYIRADETGDKLKKAAIAVKKQALRDIPVTIQSDLDAIDEPETLDNYEPVWPEI